jgi:hypothetical protein
MAISEGDLKKMLAGLKQRGLNSALFNIAHAYDRSARVAWDQIATLQDADFAAPAIMCQCFAIELLLKFFLVIPHPTAATTAELETLGVNLRGHKYTQLFDRVIDPLKMRIAASFAALSGQAMDAAGFRDKLIALGDDPFVRWRYVYEEGGFSSLDKPLLDRVTDALGKAAEVERKAITGRSS